MPGELYESYTQTWEKIDQLLMEDEDFGRLLRMKNPLADEMKALPLAQAADNEQRVALIYRLLKSRVKWNETYRLYGTDPRKALTEGTGSNADLNFLLIAMLRDADIPAYPVVMSQRTKPMIPFAHPSLNRLNTFIIAFANTDGSLSFIDTSVSNGYINLLPTTLLTDRARVIKPNPTFTHRKP